MKKFSIILFSILLTLFTSFTITSCSNVFVDSIDLSSKNVDKVGNAELKIVVPDYYAMANEGRAVAPQTVNIRLSVNKGTVAAPNFVEHTIVALPINESNKIEGAPVDFPASLYTIKFSNIPVKVYERGELKIDLLDRNNNVISSGINEGQVNISLGGTSNAIFYTIPVASFSDEDSLEKGQMKFLKKTFMSGKTYTIKPLVKEGDSFPDLVLFDEKGCYLQYCSIDDSTKSLSIAPSNNVERFIGIWADDSAVPNYTLDIQATGTLPGAINYEAFNNDGFGIGSIFDSSWIVSDSQIITLNSQIVTFAHNYSTANNQSLSRELILNDDSILSFNVQPDLYKKYDGSLDFYIDDVLVDSYTGKLIETRPLQCCYLLKEGKHIIKWKINDPNSDSTYKITKSCNIFNLKLEKAITSYNLSDGFGKDGNFALGWILRGNIKPYLVSGSGRCDALEFHFKNMDDTEVSEISKTIVAKSSSKLSYTISTDISEKYDGLVEFYIDNKKQETYTGKQLTSDEHFFIEKGRHTISWKFIGKSEYYVTNYTEKVKIDKLGITEWVMPTTINENFNHGILSNNISGSGSLSYDAVFTKWNQNTTRAPNVLKDNHGAVYELQNGESLVLRNINVTVPSCLSFDYKSDLTYMSDVQIYVDNQLLPVQLGGYGKEWLKYSIPLEPGNHKIEVSVNTPKIRSWLKNVFYVDNITLAKDVTERVDIYPKGIQETYVSGTPIQFTARALRSDGSVRENVDVFFSVNGGKITREGLFIPSKRAGTYTVTANIDGKVASNSSVIVHGENYLYEPVTIAGKTFSGGNETYVDGFFVAKDYTDTPLYIEVSKVGTNYLTHYIVRQPGNFEKRIWLRFGPGEYEVKVWKAKDLVVRDTQDYRYEGDIYSLGSLNYIGSFNVINTSSAFTTEEALWLMPSEFVQSDSFLVSNIVNAILAELPNEATIGDKLRAFHDWEIYNHHYDLVTLNHPENRKRQDAEAVIKYGLGVCEGYANLYAAILRNLGIQTKVISSNSLNHAWNHVLYNNEWYLVDTTWDDPTPEGAGDGYCDNDPYAQNYSYFMTAHTDEGHTDGGAPIVGRSIQITEELPYMRGMPNGWY